MKPGSTSHPPDWTSELSDLAFCIKMQTGSVIFPIEDLVLTRV